MWGIGMGNAKAQGGNEKKGGNEGRGAGWGIPAYAGMTGGGVGMTCPPLKSHTRLTNAIRTGRLSIGFACDTLRCIHRSLGFG